MVLRGSSPNPFSAETVIQLEVPPHMTAAVAIYNAAGRRVRQFDLPTSREGGLRVLTWDGRDEAGRELASGVYFYRLEANGEFVERKMILLK
jgi:flagellar hook assembly protein FlgD